MLSVPKMLAVPPKFYPFIERFNDFRYFVLDGGRVSTKTHTVARFLLYLADRYKINVVCGRETQESIADSVHRVLSKLIEEENLEFDVKKIDITSKTGSKFIFKGFRDQGVFNTRGLEDVDILWVDEAQALTKASIDSAIPTILRKSGCKIIFTMNRFLADDPAFVQFVGRPDCLNIHSTYLDNPYCSQEAKDEAEACKARSLRDYNHIWLGEPLDRGDDYLFDVELLNKAANAEPIGDTFQRQAILGVDLAGKGADLCVASLLERVSDFQWSLTFQQAWDEPNTNISVGKIVEMVGRLRPTSIVVDVGGLGWPMFNQMRALGLANLFAFDGGSRDKCPPNALNNRAAGYLIVREMLESGQLILKSDVTRQELLRLKLINKADGKMKLESKDDMKKAGYHSPDHADSFMMACFGARHYAAVVNRSDGAGAISGIITRKNERRQFSKQRR